MENIKIIPTYPCLAICDNEEKFVDEGQSLILQSDCVLSIYPTSQRMPSFCLDTRSNGNNEFFKVINTPTQKIFLLAQGVLCENFNVATLNVDEKPCVIELGKQSLTISCLQFKKHLKFNHSFDKYAYGTIQSHAYVLLTNSMAQDLFLFNAENGNINMFSGDEIRLNSNNFVVTKNLDNVARHIINEEYRILGQEIVRVNRTINYQEGRPVICTAEKTIPYAFLQAISVGDYELASSYLDLAMRRRIDQAHLESYFGDIKEFFIIDELTYAVRNENGMALYTFTLNDNKITEIDK